MRLDGNESEARRLLAEFRKTFDPRSEAVKDEELLEMKGNLTSELLKESKVLERKRLEENRGAIEKDIQFYETILNRGNSKA
jgi:hypothetical protein